MQQQQLHQDPMLNSICRSCGSYQRTTAAVLGKPGILQREAESKSSPWLPMGSFESTEN
jgi:hypothetical protein